MDRRFCENYAQTVKKLIKKRFKNPEKKTGLSTRRTTRFYALHYASLRGRDAILRGHDAVLRGHDAVLRDGTRFFAYNHQT